ncbi:hypothetical protein [Actinomycetospora flava]|uniref:Uncharacterized protein n=1 Tax=Actinomycetospora flava TaxID=3129232 RepID=A0ABU8LZE7_9PSEU
MRSLPILLPAGVIRARACPLASIRQVRTWRLRFVEHAAGAERLPRPAGWSDVVDAHAVPCGERTVALTGDGFRAVWDAPYEVEGPVRLRGELVVDPLDGLETTGRIHRLRLLTETVREDAAGERVVALTARDLSAIPKAVDDDSDRGVLVDLEIGVA